MNGKLASMRYYFIWAAIFLIFIFTAIKPSFMGDIGFFGSVLFWTLQMVILLPILLSVQNALQSISFFNKLNSWLLTGVAGVLSSVLFLPFALFLDYLFVFDDWEQVISFKDALRMAADEMGAVIFPVSISWVAVNAPHILQLNFQTNEETVSTVDEELPPKEHLLSFIPERIGLDIIYIASDLHYLRVVTSKGDALILYGLQNAIQDLEKTYDGVKTHRSYWVNKEHVEKIVGKANNRQVLTHQGHLIPISRRQYKLVKEVLSVSDH